MSTSRTLILILIAVTLPARWARAAVGAPPLPASDSWAVFQTAAIDRFGETGEKAAAFLAAHRPARDADIDPELLMENLEYALAARQEFPWANQVSDESFLNDVLPYAVLDEARERWRPTLHATARDIVKNASSAAEAAHSLNRELFTRVEVKYSTARAKPNQSALESMESGLASCTGLSILLVNACRSVGIPARIAGIAHWPGREGNHTWVEIWDGQQWRFTGAAEYDANGLDRAWFSSAASQAIEGHQQHAIWASSWAATGASFPLAWNPADRTVHAVDVTRRYAIPVDAAMDSNKNILLRVWDSRGGIRLTATVRTNIGDQVQESKTFADPDDINRVAELADTPHAPVRLEVSHQGETRLAWLDPVREPGRIIELFWNELSLTEADAEAAVTKLWEHLKTAQHQQRSEELTDMVVRSGDYEMRFLRRDFGEPPPTGRSLWISMHGGGGAPAEVNDRQWANQIRLYEPNEGIYIAPRAPSNEWNLWHRAEIDALFSRLIESAIIVWKVDPDRVYLLGYSAGGDGVYQLAPRMADRFAAAAMMAGHPNDASPLGLRNLPFAIFMGGQDAAYNRNKVAAEWQEQLAALRRDDPDGYPHRVEIYPDCGHWMEGRDRVALPWMYENIRQSWPKIVVWRQGGVPHTRFYWLGVSAEHAQPGRMITAKVNGQTIDVQCTDAIQIDLHLRDALIDLDESIAVRVNDQLVFKGRVQRSAEAIGESLQQRADPRSAATARLSISLPENVLSPSPQEE